MFHLTFNLVCESGVQTSLREYYITAATLHQDVKFQTKDEENIARSPRRYGGKKNPCASVRVNSSWWWRERVTDTMRVG
jgi:hypothetical protein